MSSQASYSSSIRGCSVIRMASQEPRAASGRVLFALLLSFGGGVIVGFFLMLALSPLIGNVGNWNLLAVCLCWCVLFFPTLRLLDV